MTDYHPMWAELGLDLERHDVLLEALGGMYSDLFLTQKNRPGVRTGASSRRATDGGWRPILSPMASSPRSRRTRSGPGTSIQTVAL